MENEIVMEYGVAYEQINKLCSIYKDLIVTKENGENIVLDGSILVNSRIDNFTLYKTYLVRIVFFPGTNHLPLIYEVGGLVDSDYQHKYEDGQLCLETDTFIRWYFRDGFDLEKWMEHFVVSYFVSYEFYKKYGEFPFGDRGHGHIGILQAYKGIFDIEDEKMAWIMMNFILKNRYRGHWICPCGSGKTIRNCHGKKILEFYNRSTLYESLQADVDIVKNEVIQIREMLKGKRR